MRKTELADQVESKLKDYTKGNTMLTQTIPNGSKVIINIETVESLHGREATVQSFNSSAINLDREKVGIYGVTVEGERTPYWLYESEMKVVRRGPGTGDSLRDQALNYVEELLIEAQADVKDTTAVLAQQKERVVTLTKLADLLAEG